MITTGPQGPTKISELNPGRFIGDKTSHGKINSILQPAVERFGHRWQQAVLNEDSDELEGLKEFRKTLGAYAKYYDFFSQILNYGDEYYEKFAAYTEKLQRKLNSFTEEDTNPGYIDLDEVVLTHYKLEKLREEELSPKGGGEGLRGITEAGISRGSGPKRGSWEEVIERVNQYLGGLDVDDEYKLRFTQTLMDVVLRDDRLSAPAQNNSRADFQYSSAVRVAVEDAVWSMEDSTHSLLKRLRDLPPAEQVAMMMDLGLYERIRGEWEAA